MVLGLLRRVALDVHDVGLGVEVEFPDLFDDCVTRTYRVPAEFRSGSVTGWVGGVAIRHRDPRDFRRAMQAMDWGDIETRVSELNHVLTVIEHTRCCIAGSAASI